MRLLLVIAFLAVAAPVRAQVFSGEPQEGRLHARMYGAVAEPSVFLQNARTYRYAEAVTGVGGGADLLMPVGHPHVALLLSASLLAHTMEIHPSGLRGPGAVAEADAWLVLPVLAGISLRGQVSPQLDVYLDLAAGFAWIRPPDMYLKDITQEYSLEFESVVTAPWSDPAFSAGAGLIIGRAFFLGLRYVDCGSPELTFRKVLPENRTIGDMYVNQSVDLWALTFGIVL